MGPPPRGRRQALGKDGNGDPVTQASSERTCTCTHFHVVSHDVRWPADRVARMCARLRPALQQRWLPRQKALLPRWDPPCEVEVHADEGAYLRRVGWHAALTRGACRVEVQSRRIVGRRIDLVADPATGKLTALTHELTHVVLADQFAMRRLPRWVDEGIALLADDPGKKRLHLEALHEAIRANRCQPLAEIVNRRSYPSDSDIPMFYGQSLSLVSFLVKLDEPHKVVELASLAMDRGYDRALNEVYGIRNLSELEQRWLASVAARGPGPLLSASAFRPTAMNGRSSLSTRARSCSKAKAQRMLGRKDVARNMLACRHLRPAYTRRANCLNRPGAEMETPDTCARSSVTGCTRFEHGTIRDAQSAAFFDGFISLKSLLYSVISHSGSRPVLAACSSGMFIAWLGMHGYRVIECHVPGGAGKPLGFRCVGGAM